MWKTAGLLMISLSSSLHANFDKDRIRKHIQTLASKEFEGRAPLSAGEHKTVAYLTDEYKALGLKPLPGKDQFYDDVPICSVKTKVKPKGIRLGSATLAPNVDIALQSNSKKQILSLQNVDVVFVGYGIVSERWNWNDYANIDVKGKIVVTLVNDPGFATGDPSLFNGKDMTYFGRWTYKFEEAKRRGAIGAFVIHEDAAAGYGWDVVASRDDGHAILDEGKATDSFPMQGWLHANAARQLFAQLGLNFDTEKRKATSRGYMPVKFHKGAFSIDADNTVTCAKSKNICGMLEGKANPNEFVLISAHWDHLGKKIDANGQTHIFAGAIDNASGVAAMFEIANYFKNKELKRSLAFCSFTAEEQGLLGAYHFLKKPPMPLKQIKGMINFDSMNMGDRNPEIVGYGDSDNPLMTLLTDKAKQQGRRVIPDPHGEKGYFFRSDHYPFVMRNVPALLYMDIGFTDPNYLKNGYHKETDVYHPSWTLDGLIQDLTLYSSIIEELL